MALHKKTVRIRGQRGTRAQNSPVRCPPSIFRLRSRGPPSSSGAMGPKQIIITPPAMVAVEWERERERGSVRRPCHQAHHPQFGPISLLATLSKERGPPSPPRPGNMHMAWQSQRCELVQGAKCFSGQKVA